jgi:hypothetical protein
MTSWPGRSPGGTGPRRTSAADEFAVRELGAVLGETRGIAEDILSLAYALEVSLPGTKAAFRSGVVSQRKAMVLCEATALLDPAEARAAEAWCWAGRGR